MQKPMRTVSSHMRHEAGPYLWDSVGGVGASTEPREQAASPWLHQKEERIPMSLDWCAIAANADG